MEVGNGLEQGFTTGRSANIFLKIAKAIPARYAKSGLISS